jgi:hypothetical protein
MRARRRLKGIPEVKWRELVERSLDLGISAAPSIKDRNISLFSRGLDPMFAGRKGARPRGRPNRVSWLLFGPDRADPLI